MSSSGSTMRSAYRNASSAGDYEPAQQIFPQHREVHREVLSDGDSRTGVAQALRERSALPLYRSMLVSGRLVDVTPRLLDKRVRVRELHEHRHDRDEHQPAIHSAAVNCQPISSQRMMPSSSTRLESAKPRMRLQPTCHAIPTESIRASPIFASSTT